MGSRRLQPRKLAGWRHAAWSEWASMGSLPGGTTPLMPGLPFTPIGYLTDGRMQVFYIGSDYGLYSMWKTGPDPNAAWSPWTAMGSPEIQTVTVGYLPDNRMQIFAVDGGGNVHSIWKTSTDPNSSWSDWQNMGSVAPGADPFVSVAVGYLPDRDCPEIWGIMMIGIGPAGYVADWGSADGMDAAFGWDGD